MKIGSVEIPGSVFAKQVFVTEAQNYDMESEPASEYCFVGTESSSNDGSFGWFMPDADVHAGRIIRTTNLTTSFDIKIRGQADSNTINWGGVRQLQRMRRQAPGSSTVWQANGGYWNAIGK